MNEHVKIIRLMSTMALLIATLAAPACGKTSSKPESPVEDAGPSTDDTGIVDSADVGSDVGFPDAAEVGVGLTDCTDDFPIAQGISEPCCPEWGIDACGAELFCAAFDGRNQPVCYEEGSRDGGETCGEDRHCGTGRCNTNVGKCLGSLTCDPEAGCADDEEYCVRREDEAGSFWCQPSSGEFGAPCRRPEECQRFECSGADASTPGTCDNPPGSVCAPCVDGECFFDCESLTGGCVCEDGICQPLSEFEDGIGKCCDASVVDSCCDTPGCGLICTDLVGPGICLPE